MKFLFLVGSSIKHFHEDEFSAYNQQQRFEQTLDTINCIREKVPESYIILFECSQFEISSKYKDTFREKCDLFLEFYDDPVMKTIYGNIENRPELITFGKSLLETRGLLRTLYTIREHNLFSDAQRIFKFSGRYLLNEYFDINDYQSKFLEWKYVIKSYEYTDEEMTEYDGKELANVYAYLYGSKGTMVTGLWSFDRYLFNDAVETLEKSLLYMERMIQFTAGTDVEHSLYRFLDKKNVISIPNLGLTAIKGMKNEDYSRYDI